MCQRWWAVINTKNMKILFSSSISNLIERNASFDSGVLRVAYVGKNRNNSFISKETFERCMPSIYNCPIVCRYDREEDVIGSHDIELVTSDDGSMRVVNATYPVGVIPENSAWWWEEIEDTSGIHEYLCVNALIWKRQEAYRKIKENGITDESMEITVKEGRMVDGVYVIDCFEFTAFCLLGTAEPCYESASLEMFSCSDFKKQFADMMRDFQKTFGAMQPPKENFAKQCHPDLGGGEKALGEEKRKLMAEFGLTEDKLDFSIEDFSVEELRIKFGQLKNSDNELTEATKDESEKFELGSQFMKEIIAAMEAETITTDWGSMPRYWFVDYDMDAAEVYAEDRENDWNLYGFHYSMDGDRVVIDFTCKKRKKYSIVDFDEGEQIAPAGKLFELANKRFSEINTEWAEKYQKALDTAAANDAELSALRKFKADAERTVEQDKRNELFDKFEDLNGVEAFETLRKHGMEYGLAALEEKCFAIRGRIASEAKFSLNPKSPKLFIEKHDAEPEKEPYGGLFAEYGVLEPEKKN